MFSESTFPSHSSGRPLAAAAGDVDAKVRRSVLAEGCAQLGASNAWVVRHDSSGCQFIMVLNPEVEIGVEGGAVLEVAAYAGLSLGLQLVCLQNDTLLCTCMSDGRDAGRVIYSLGLLFAGRYSPTERQMGIVEGLRCTLRVLFRGALTEPRLDLQAHRSKMMVACSCCRRVQTKQHGWMNWDDLHFIQTGQGCSHTVCDQCAAALYQDVLCGKD